MQFTRRFFLLILVFLFVPGTGFAQSAVTQNAAQKSWNTFWNQFTSAVNRKSKAAVKALMASESDFFSGGGGETRDEWLQMVHEQQWWGRLQKSVRAGTKISNWGGKPGRVTNDNHLTFTYLRGRWRFTGLVGD